MSNNTASSSTASKPKRRFVGSRAGPKPGGSSALPIAHRIPEEILNDPQLNAAIAQLPANYSFEIHKTIHHVRKNDAKMVALQMPEGLQMFACTIADIVERFTDALTVIMGDVTYGACCIDDYTAVALGCDMMVHYGHSCLVPIDQTSIKTLYIFVEIAIDVQHLAHTVRLNFPDDRTRFHDSLLDEDEVHRAAIGQQVGSGRHLRIEKSTGNQSSEDQDTAVVKVDPSQSQNPGRIPTRLALVSTIQFVAALQRLKDDLSVTYTDSTPFRQPQALLTDNPDTESFATTSPQLWTGAYEATIPRSKPLSPGEILGCTAPRLGQDADAIIYLGDGRFHLEAIMIANPDVPAFRYDPYSKKFTRERYDHSLMRTVRTDAVRTARRSIEHIGSSLASDASDGISKTPDDVPLWGVILGTLGRQGSFKQLQAITLQLAASRIAIPFMPILLSELSPAKLSLFSSNVSTFVQTSCPRLSIDWGYAFDKPLLSPYETSVAVGQDTAWMSPPQEKQKSTVYPMDFYEAGTPWAISRAKGVF